MSFPSHFIVTSSSRSAALALVRETSDNPASTPTQVKYAWNLLEQIKAETMPGVVSKNTCFDVGRHPNLPVESMREMVKSGDADLCEGVAANPNVPTDILVFLRMNPNEWVRRLVVKNSNCPVELLEPYDIDGPMVQSVIASKPNVSLSVLEAMVASFNSSGSGKDFRSVLGAIAINPVTPVGLAVEAWNKLTSLYATSYATESWLKFLPTPVLLIVLQDHYPTLLEGLPREWLLQLWKVVFNDDEVDLLTTLVPS